MSVNYNKKIKPKPTKSKTTRTKNYNNNDNSKKMVILFLTVLLIVLLVIFFVQLFKVLNPNFTIDKENKTEVTTQNSKSEDFNAKQENSKEENSKEENSKEESSKEENTEENVQEENTQKNIIPLKNISTDSSDGVITNENGDIVVTNLEFEQVNSEDYILRGVVENRSSDTVYSLVPLNISYYNKNGEMTNRDAFEIVNYNGIMSNETQEFSGIGSLSKMEATYKPEIHWDYVAQPASTKTKVNTSSGKTVQNVNGDIVVENISIKQSALGFNEVTGTVKNKSTNTVYSSVLMQIKYYDKNGKIYNTEVCSVVEYDGVKPNETIEFSEFGYPYGIFATYEVEILENYRTE